MRLHDLVDDHRLLHEFGAQREPAASGDQAARFDQILKAAFAFAGSNLARRLAAAEPGAASACASAAGRPRARPKRGAHDNDKPSANVAMRSRLPASSSAKGRAARPPIAGEGGRRFARAAPAAWSRALADTAVGGPAAAAALRSMPSTVARNSAAGSRASLRASDHASRTPASRACSGDTKQNAKSSIDSTPTRAIKADAASRSSAGTRHPEPPNTAASMMQTKTHDYAPRQNESTATN